MATEEENAWVDYVVQKKHEGITNSDLRRKLEEDNVNPVRINWVMKTADEIYLIELQEKRGFKIPKPGRLVRTIILLLLLIYLVSELVQGRVPGLFLVLFLWFSLRYVGILGGGFEVLSDKFKRRW